MFNRFNLTGDLRYFESNHPIEDVESIKFADPNYDRDIGEQLTGRYDIRFFSLAKKRFDEIDCDYVLLADGQLVRVLKVELIKSNLDVVNIRGHIHFLHYNAIWVCGIPFHVDLKNFNFVVVKDINHLPSEPKKCSEVFTETVPDFHFDGLRINTILEGNLQFVSGRVVAEVEEKHKASCVEFREGVFKRLDISKVKGGEEVLLSNGDVATIDRIDFILTKEIKDFFSDNVNTVITSKYEFSEFTEREKKLLTEKFDTYWVITIDREDDFKKVPVLCNCDESFVQISDESVLKYGWLKDGVDFLNDNTIIL
jgi:hypothetical protein